jgi:transposase-like protein
MVTSPRYFDLVCEMKDPTTIRLRLVESAKKRGIKPTAKLFSTTAPTVRKWLRRYQQRGPSGLLARACALHHQTQKIPSLAESQLVELKLFPPSDRCA